MTVKVKTQMTIQLTQELKMLQLKMLKHKLKNLKRSPPRKLRKLSNMFNKKKSKMNLQSKLLMPK
jgi:hypothetical protein